MKKKFKPEYAKAIVIKRREEMRKRAEEEEVEEAHANLIHKGQMMIYSAAETGYCGIKANLEKASMANDETNSDDEDEELADNGTKTGLTKDNGKENINDQ